jgi:hypothetical protein
MTKYNWYNISGCFRWVARNRDEVIWAFGERPELDKEGGVWQGGMPAVRLGGAPYCLIQDGWTNSLEERPTPPDTYEVRFDANISASRIYRNDDFCYMSLSEVARKLNEYDRESMND